MEINFILYGWATYVMSNISIHIIYVYDLLNGIIKTIKCMMTSFIWGGSENNRQIVSYMEQYVQTNIGRGFEDQKTHKSNADFKNENGMVRNQQR